MTAAKVHKRVHRDGWTQETVMMTIPVYLLYEKPAGRAIALRAAKILSTGRALVTSGGGLNDKGAFNVRLGRLQGEVKQGDRK